MENILGLTKRKNRTTTDSASSSGSPDTKKLRESEQDESEQDEVFVALDMAADLASKLDLILERLTSIETRVGGIEAHVQSVDQNVVELQRKMGSLEEVVRKTEVKVFEMDAGLSFLNSEVEFLKRELEVVKADHKKDMASFEKEALYKDVYYRRENLRFYGIAESDEGEEDTKELLREFFKTTLGIENADSFEFQRAHRIGKFNAEHDKPRQVIARFLRYPDREDVFSRVSKLKGSGIAISPDLPKKIVEARKKLVPLLKIAKSEGKSAHFSWARPDELYVDDVLTTG